MKLSVYCVITDDTFYLEMMIKSIIEVADEIIIVDNSDNFNNKNLCESFKDYKIKYYRLDFKNDFGLAREFAHQQCTGDWNLALDADEVIHELNAPQIKKLLEDIEKKDKKIDCCNLEYIHFIHDFAHIDNSEPVHLGLSRLYRNYPDVNFRWAKNHSYPRYNWKKAIIVPQLKIWHMGYLRGMEKIRERFDRNYHFSEIHTPFFQTKWRDWHYYGHYPTKKINHKLIPQVIKEAFLMELK